MQSQVGINTNSPDPSSVLDIQSSDKGVLYPRMSNAERDGIQDPALGLMVFNTTTGCLNMFNGIIWTEICGSRPSDFRFIDAIYVSPDGDDDTGDGSPMHPFATYQKGRNEMSFLGKDTLVLAAGNYQVADFLMNQVDSITVLGGFEGQYWTRDIEQFQTVIEMGFISPAKISSSEEITLDGLTIRQDTTYYNLDNAVYGLLVQGSTGIRIMSCKLFAGNGPKGFDGNNGDPGTPGTNGNPPDLYIGGQGGNIGGGTGGVGEVSGIFSAQDGNPGNGGAPGGIAPGGNGGNGADGTDGSNGDGGQSFGIAQMNYQAGIAQNGTIGTPGFGGGGGAGGEGSGNNGGSGGGGGGGAGGIGQAGYNGGGSFGLYAYNSTVFIESSVIESSDGGSGGQGGEGGIGGMGGLGGAPGSGGTGGHGGKGGDSGHGGGGGGGPSFAVYSAGTSVITLINTVLTHGQGGSGGSSPGNPGQNGLSGDQNF